MDVLLLFQLIGPLLFLAVGGGAGRVVERGHERSLTRREAAIAGVVVTDLRHAPPGCVGAHLVSGDVVIATDYGKHLAGRVRTVLGGEVRSMRRMLDRGRREALLRVREQAASVGADLVVNVRFHTMEVDGRSAEVSCYGTAVRRP